MWTGGITVRIFMRRPCLLFGPVNIYRSKCPVKSENLCEVCFSDIELMMQNVYLVFFCINIFCFRCQFCQLYSLRFPTFMTRKNTDSKQVITLYWKIFQLDTIKKLISVKYDMHLNVHVLLLFTISIIKSNIFIYCWIWLICSCK